MPEVSTYAMPLTEIQWNGHPFKWREVHNQCFQMIKDLACKYLILKPIDPRKEEPIWLVCDASLYGVSTLDRQGNDWRTCHPAGFMSKKLSDAQQNYRTFKHKTLMIIEALLKWEDKLLGFKFKIVTDHEALGYLRTQRKLSSRQIHWINYMSWFDTKIIYAKGLENHIADCLSHYYKGEEGDSTSNEEINWANTDVHLDLEGDDLLQDRWLELKAITIEGESNPWKSKHFAEKWEYQNRQTAMSDGAQTVQGIEYSVWNSQGIGLWIVMKNEKLG